MNDMTMTGAGGVPGDQSPEGDEPEDTNEETDEDRNNDAWVAREKRKCDVRRLRAKAAEAEYEAETKRHEKNEAAAVAAGAWAATAEKYVLAAIAVAGLIGLILVAARKDDGGTA